MKIALILVFLIIIGLGILTYITLTNDRLHKFVNDSFNNNNNLGNNIDEYIHDNMNFPLDTNTFINTFNFADKKQDSRTDELLKSIDKILFWIRIIGIYFLFKIILFILAAIKDVSILQMLFESMKLL